MPYNEHHNVFTTDPTAAAARILSQQAAPAAEAAPPLQTTINPIPGLTKGRMVHYVPFESDGFKNHNHHEHLVAVVVRVYNHETGLVNLRLLLDGTNDHDLWQSKEWIGSRLHSETHEPGTWHFIEKA